MAHASDRYCALYATSRAGADGGSDGADLDRSTIRPMTMRLCGPGLASNPWETLEQPSCGFLYGRRAGTITLNQWVAMASLLPATIRLRDPGLAPRPMSLGRCLERLWELEAGLELDDEELLYETLYGRILRDPDRRSSPHKALDRQMTDLILVLSRPGWIDFGDGRNQVATRFIFDRGPDREPLFGRFFHQLLLSLELELRIEAAHHGRRAKEKLLAQLPPTIRWDLALARRWREHVRIEAWGPTADDSESAAGGWRR